MTSHSPQDPSDNRTGYYHYFDFGMGGYIDRLLLRVRREVLAIFLEEFSPTEEDLILDVGVSADDHISSNYFEKHYPHAHKITAVGLEKLTELEEQFLGLAFVRGDGRYLPFSDGSFDYVQSHAVVEHVGSRVEQERFVGELLRVAKEGVLFTTPNRLHPIETHTGLPFLHYLPRWLYGAAYRALGKDMYADKEALNLLTPRSVKELCSHCISSPSEVTIRRIRWLGLTSNIVVCIAMQPGQPSQESGRSARRSGRRSSRRRRSPP